MPYTYKIEFDVSPAGFAHAMEALAGWFKTNDRIEIDWTGPAGGCPHVTWYASFDKPGAETMVGVLDFILYGGSMKGNMDDICTITDLRE